MRRRLSVLAIIVFSAALAEAQAPAGKQPPRRAEKQPEAAEKSPQQAFLDGERRVAFPKSHAPWTEVIEWFSDETGLPFIGGGVPIGSFRYTGFEGSTYSCSEVIDILNEELSRIEYLLLRRDQAFTVLSVDGPLGSHMIRRVSRRDIDTLGKSEIVQLGVGLRKANAEELAPLVKKELGPFGSVVALTSANQILITDAAGNLRRMLKLLDSIERVDRLGDYAYKCIYVRADEAEQMVKEHLGELPQVAELVGMARRAESSATLRADVRANILFVNGRPHVIAKIKSLLKTLDLQQSSVPRPFFGPEFRNFDVPAGQAERLVQILSNLPAFRASQTFRMIAASHERIVVYGFSEQRSQLEAALTVCLVLPPVMTDGFSALFGRGVQIADTLYEFVGDSMSGHDVPPRDNRRAAAR